MTTLCHSRCVSAPVTLHDTRSFLVDRHPAFWGTPYIDVPSHAASKTSLPMESGYVVSPNLHTSPSASSRSSSFGHNTLLKSELSTGTQALGCTRLHRRTSNEDPSRPKKKLYGELTALKNDAPTTPSSKCGSPKEECQPEQSLSTTTGSASECSTDEVDGGLENFDKPVCRDISETLEIGQGRKRMTRWLKTLKGKSKMPRMSLELLDDGDSMSQRFSLGTVRSTNTGRTQLTSSTCFIGQMRPATMSGRSASYCPSMSSASVTLERDGIATPEPSEVFDFATVCRSRQRRKIIEEIISSEEAYLEDLRTLSSVYDHATISVTDIERRKNIKHNFVDLVEIHERLLSTVLKSFPSSAPSVVCDHAGHTKVIEVSPDIAQLARGNGLADPHAVKSICSIFEELQPSFFAYEEYSATYDDMMHGIRDDYKLYEEWKTWESGYEMLANTVQSIDNKAAFHGKKAVTLFDLLIKPIHRICRYPLLFKQLLRFTPVIDCPVSNLALQQIITLYEEIVTRVDQIRAKESVLKEQLQKTWLLRDRIQFVEVSISTIMVQTITNDMQKNDASNKIPLHTSSQHRLREMGKVLMCGTLYVAWPNQSSFEGAYLACILYSTHFIIAGFEGHSVLHSRYPIQFLLPLNKLNIEESDEGRGFRCPSAPHSWKLSFKTEKSTFEIVLCGSTAREGEMWRTNLQQSICTSKEKLDHINHKRSLGLRDSALTKNCIVPDDLKPIAKAVPHAHARSRSVLSGNSNTSECFNRLEPVKQARTMETLYILNTDLSSDILSKSTPASPSSPHRYPFKHDIITTGVLGNSSQVYRSRSISGGATGNRIYTLSSTRHERAKVEQFLCDVWSLELLEPLTMLMASRSLSSSGRASAMSNRSVSRGSLQSETTLIRKLSNHGISLPWPSRKKSYPGLQPAGKDIENTSSETQTHSSDEGAWVPQMSPRSNSYTFGRTPSKRQAIGLRLNTVVGRPSTCKQEVLDTQENIDLASSIKAPKRSKSIMRKTSSEKAVPTKAECWWLVNGDSSSSNQTSPAHSDYELDLSPTTIKPFMMPPPTRTPVNGRGNLRRFLTGF